MRKIYLMFLLISGATLLRSQCIPPDAIYATNISFTSADISWSGGLPPAPEYIVNYRMIGDTDTNWLAASVFDDSLLSIYALDTCTFYQFRVIAVCDIVNQAATEIDTFMTLCDSPNTSILELLFYPEVLIFPNPSNGILNIRFDEPVFGDVYIFMRNGSGVLLYKEKLVMSGENQIDNLSTAELGRGIHYLTVIYNGKLFTNELFQTDL